MDKNSNYFVIRCRLSSDDSTRKQMWELMRCYSLLVNDLLEEVPKVPDFVEWREKGFVSEKWLIEKIKELGYENLPGRFRTSAKILTKNIFKSWFSLQRKRSNKISRKLRWIKVLQSEIKLIQTTDFEIDRVVKAAKTALGIAKKRKDEASKEDQATSKTLFSVLMNMHFETKSDLRKRGINHLLLNDLNIRHEEIRIANLKKRLRIKYIEIENLEKQLRSRLPKGRDPEGQRYVVALHEACALPQIPLEEKAFYEGQAKLPLYNEMPYPLIFEGATNLSWLLEKRQKSERLSVYFNGIAGLKFSVQCGRSQLPVFKGFYEDASVNRERVQNNKIPFSQGLNRFRSAQIIWKPDPDYKFKQEHRKLTSEPWQSNRLHMHCAVDRRTLTLEGTKAVRQEKIDKFTQNAKDAEEKKKITENPRKLTELYNLEHAELPPRPSIQPYIGNSELAVSLCFSPDEPVTIVLVNLRQKTVLKTLTTKALLNQNAKQIFRGGKQETLLEDGKDRHHENGGKFRVRAPGKLVKYKPYSLVLRLNHMAGQSSKRRASEQSQHKYRRSDSVSNLSQYVCRLIASKISEFSIRSQACTVIVPDLEGIREWIEAFVRDIAIRKFPDSKKQQKRFRQEYRAKYHRWSYGELAADIERCAVKSGLVTIGKRQPTLQAVNKYFEMDLVEQDLEYFKHAALMMALVGDEKV